MSSMPVVPPNEARALAPLICSACGAPGEGSCSCGVPYVPPGQRAAEAIKRSPDKSDRAIAEELGVGNKTVSRARSTVSRDTVQTRTGRDGKKRRMPRRKRSAVYPESKRLAAAQVVLDEGKPRDQAAAEFGLSEHVVQLDVERERGRREVIIDPGTLPLSARERLESVIRQEKRNLKAEFERAVQSEIKRIIDETVLPQYKKEKAEARQIIESRKGVMTRASYKLIISCLHPDRVSDAEQKERYTKAFHAFSALELVLCNEKEMPTISAPIPRTYEELMKRRAEVMARRKQNKNAISH